MTADPLRRASPTTQQGSTTEPKLTVHVWMSLREAVNMAEDSPLIINLVVSWAG